MLRFIAVVFTLAVYIVNTEAVDEWKTGFTTNGLEGLFKTKCKQFGKLPRTAEIYDENKFNDEGCRDIWTKFIEVIDGKKKETVREGYRNFFKYIEDNFYKSDFKKDEYFKDKVTFWSGPVPQKVGNWISANNNMKLKNNYLTLASLVQGFVVDIDGIAWCGDPDPKDPKKGVIYEKDRDLQTGTHCSYSPVQLYWEEASKDLAEKADGEAHLLLPAVTTDNYKAYRKDSFFADIELPKLDECGKIKLLSVTLLYHNILSITAVCWDDPNIDIAKDKSLSILENQITKETKHIKDINYTCAKMRIPVVPGGMMVPMLRR